MGLYDHAHLFHNFDHAVKLRRDLTHLLKVKDKVKVVIGGGGPAGVELAGTLANLRHTNGHMHIDLIEATSHILSGFPRIVVDRASDFLKKLEVGVYTNQPIKKVKNDRVILADDRSIPFDIFVWTGGVKANAVVSEAGFETDKRGRAYVRSTLQARGFARVYALGDSAAFEVGKKTLPFIAPHARKESHFIAHNIIRQIKGQAPRDFRPSRYPVIISIGRSVAFLVIGPLAFWGKRFVWLRNLVNWYVIHFDLN
jgi:NADH dehydrogenase